jgi:hypothetical protein
MALLRTPSYADSSAAVAVLAVAGAETGRAAVSHGAVDPLGAGSTTAGPAGEEE